MSKGGSIDQGPGASSFEDPAKVGWLYKHGGSGVSSHWRKRWFVADHHYLFYYKGPNDKKPVGIVCLPDYESCHKAEAKVWKKQYAFMLDRGNTTQEQDASEGATTKNYVLYADSEEEMKEWIEALTEEIKPMIGENRYANGFSGGKTNTIGKGGGGGTKQKKKKGDQDTVAVDDKALDDVTAMAGEGPKLTHLTASRPKVPRGRRPPKRYAVFHEDDSKPEVQESPPDTPESLTKPSEPPPSESPGTQRKKGQKPSAPLLPHFNRATSVKISPKTPPTPPAKVIRSDTDLDMAEPESPSAVVQKTKFAKPPPPKKPVKEKPESPELTEPSASSRIQRPTPPVKPVKEGKETTAVEKNENVTLPTEDVTKPSPVKKPRPQPPIKPRASPVTVTADNTTAAATQVAESAPQSTRPTPAPRPVPRKRTMTPQASPVREQAKEPAIPEEQPMSVSTEPEVVSPPAISTTEENKSVSFTETAVQAKETGPLNIPVKDEGILEIREEAKPQPEIKEEGAAAEIHKEEEDIVLTNEMQDKKIAKPPEAEMVKEDEGQELEPKEAQGEEEERDEKSGDDSGGDTYEIMDIGEKSEGSQEKELQQDNDYENVKFGILEAADIKKEEKRGKKEKDEEEVLVMVAEVTKKDVASRRVNQYDEVAGDWMPPKPRPKVNPYDEVAGDFPPQKSTTASTPSQDGVSLDAAVCLSPGYEHKELAAATSLRIDDQGQRGLLDSDYVPMKDGVIVNLNGKEDSLEISQTSIDKSGGYEHIEAWVERAPPTKDLHNIAPPSNLLAASYGDYNVTTSSGTSPNHEQVTLLSPEKNGRQSVVSSSGSTSSLKSDSQLKARSGSGDAAVGSSGDEGRRRGSSSVSSRSKDGSENKSAQMSELERDPLGYTKVKQNGAERLDSDISELNRRASEVPPEIIPIAPSIEEAQEMSVSEALKQAKEVLRLAKVVKAEAEEMREEARKELSLVKKDRRDAMILKKNAAEILRMAKERLASAK